MAAKSLTTLLAGIVDYAGLFPPAALSMGDAVRNYAHYLKEPDAWALGRFIVPVSRLAEFEREVQHHFPHALLWRLSVLGGSDIPNDLTVISDFNSRYDNRAVIDTIELKASSTEVILSIASVIAKSFQIFIEIPINTDPTTLIQEVAKFGLQAKVRTGGVTADAFPRSSDLVRFLHACVKANVRFKATAGLHHPVRSVYNLTYRPDSEKEKMYGYLNVFLAAAFLAHGVLVEEARDLLEEESWNAFQFDDNGVTWRSHWLDIENLKNSRKNLALSFGSCSFREPLEDLRVMKLL